MEKAESAPLPKAQAAKAKPGPTKPGKKALQPKVSFAFDRAEVAKMIDQIREEVEFHRGCATEVKARLEKLTGTALSELLKVKELKSIISSLKENGRENPDPGTPGATVEGTVPGYEPDPREQWRRELDRELEKLLVIRKLLEAKLPAAADKKERQDAGPGPDGTKRILVVDDDPTTVKVISHFLQKESYQVSTSLSGVEGLKKAFQEVPDLILLDVMMPDLNGFQFLSIYRKVRENARTPVIILSSLSEEADMLKGLEIGAVDYITKPFSPQLLMAKIKKSLNSGP
jgi:CheY-like chemotaxis protein